jgi:hypothetical protein
MIENPYHTYGRAHGFDSVPANDREKMCSLCAGGPAHWRETNTGECVCISCYAELVAVCPRCLITHDEETLSAEQSDTECHCGFALTHPTYERI